jgi:DNA-binding PadR family transcriptional regulator
MRHGRRSRARSRVSADAAWTVRARVERFAEPALLVLLADRPTHGYELLEQLPEILGEHRVDVGNLYRALRALEDEGLVVSEWSADLPGPAKRTYVLTAEGREVLAAWLDALTQLRAELGLFIERGRKGGDHVRETSQELASSEP